MPARWRRRQQPALGGRVASPAVGLAEPLDLGEQLVGGAVELLAARRLATARRVSPAASATCAARYRRHQATGRRRAGARRPSRPPGRRRPRPRSRRPSRPRRSAPAPITLAPVPMLTSRSIVAPRTSPARRPIVTNGRDHRARVDLDQPVDHDLAVDQVDARVDEDGSPIETCATAIASRCAMRGRTGTPRACRRAFSAVERLRRGRRR